MLNTPKLNLMQELIAGSSREELIWLSGYLAGVVAAQGYPAAAQAQAGTQAYPAALAQTAGAPVAESAVPAINKITIAYGTETGN